MKLKEIKPGIAIHCTEKEQVKVLVENGIIRSSMLELKPPIWIAIRENSQDWEPEVKTGKSYYKIYCGLECIEFSDLIIPELTAEEVLQICAEICEGRECDDCPMRGGDCFENPDSDKSKIVKICEQWKTDHEKKEPEVEWVYRVFGAENFGEKFFDTEEEAIKRCEELAKSQKTKKYTRYEHICRVKAVE